MTKTRHIRRKHKGGSFASATRRIWWSRKISINQDKKKEWMEGYNSKKAELKEFADKYHLANFSEEDFANGVCSNLYDDDASKWRHWGTMKNPQNYYYIKGKDPNKTYTFEQAEERIYDPNLPEPTKDKPKPVSIAERKHLDTSPAILPGLLNFDDLDDFGLDLDDKNNDNPREDVIPEPLPPHNQTRKNQESNINHLGEVDVRMAEFNKLFNEQIANPKIDFTNKSPIPIEDQQTFAKKNLKKNPDFGSIGKKSKEGKIVGGRGWFGLGKGFGKGFQHHMYYSKIKPDSDKKRKWKDEYNRTKKRLAKVRKIHFDLNEEKYEKGLYPSNIKNICTETTPNPPNYYYIEGWKGDKRGGENLTYLEAKQRIYGMNADIKRKQNEQQHHKTQKTQQQNLNSSNFSEITELEAGPSPQNSPQNSPKHSSNISNNDEDVIHVG